MKYGVNTQRRIYMNGMAGKKNPVPITFTNLRTKAQKKMSPEAWVYIAGGAGMGDTMEANRKEFKRYQLHGRMMKAATKVDMSITLFGKKYETPLLTAPIGVLDLVHEKGDLEVAKACANKNIPMIFSNQASTPMEECATEMGNNPRWFQLYWSKSDALMESLVKRAEKVGCEAIVVTLDTAFLGWRPQGLEKAYSPFMRARGIAQYYSDPVFQKLVEENMLGKDDSGPKPPINLTTLKNVFELCRNYPGGFFKNLTSQRAMVGVRTFVDTFMNPGLRWEDLKKLRDITDLPILVKGVHHLEDADAAIKYGVDGIIVSNHGGRQVDGGVPAISALELIANKYAGKLPLLFDSGIRCGADVIKALALGADAVLIGRPYVYGLAIDGSRGVETIFDYYLSEMELQLSLMGVSSIKELNADFIQKTQ